MEIKEAKLLVKLFWLAFNNINMYGNKHPTVDQSISKLEKFLKSLAETNDKFSIIKKNQRIFCNEHRVDRILKLDRLLERMEFLQLEYIQFPKDITIEQLHVFLKHFADSKNVSNNESFNKKLNESQNNFQINDSSKESMLFENLANIGRNSSNNSLSDTINSIPEEVRNVFFTSVNNATVNKKISPVDFQEQMKKNISDSITPDLYLKYLLSFKHIAQNSNIKNNLLNEDVNQESIVTGINSILQTNINEIFNKYLAGRISLFTLGSIVHMSFKSKKEISAILLIIKSAICNEGYYLSRYLLFLEKLSWTLHEDGLNQMIDKLNGDIGVSLKEIRGALRKSNQGSIPLILLIYKLAQNFKLNRKKMVSILSFEIEEALLVKSREKLLKLKNPSLKEIKTTLINLEKHVIFQIISGDLAEDIVREISNILENKFEFRVGLLWSYLITKNVLNNRGLSKEEKLNQILKKTIEQENFSKLYNPLILTLEQSGFEKELIDEVISKINQTEKINLPQVISKELTFPSEIKHIEMTKEILKMEIYRSLRYKTPFSTISISIMGIKTNAGYRNAKNEEKLEIINQLPSKLESCLRHLDIIGTVGDLKNDHILLLLPMTDPDGAKIVMQRLQHSFSNIQFTLFNIVNHAYLLFSTCSMDDSLSDTQIFLSKVNSHHLKKAKEISKYLY